MSCACLRIGRERSIPYAPSCGEQDVPGDGKLAAALRRKAVVFQMTCGFFGWAGAKRIGRLGVAAALAIVLGTLSAAAIGASESRATMRVSAVVLATGCPAGRIAPACVQPTKSVTRVENHASAASTPAGTVEAVPSDSTVELFVVTLMY